MQTRKAGAIQGLKRNFDTFCIPFCQRKHAEPCWGCKSVPLCASCFLQHVQTHSGSLQTFAGTKNPCAWHTSALMSLHRRIYSTKTAILQRMLKASHNFPVTNHTLSKSTLIAETSTTTPAYPYHHYVWPEVLHLDPSFLFSFHLSELPLFTFSYNFFHQPWSSISLLHKGCWGRVMCTKIY